MWQSALFLHAIHHLAITEDMAAISFTVHFPPVAPRTPMSCAQHCRAQCLREATGRERAVRPTPANMPGMGRTAYPRWLAAGERARMERARAGNRGHWESLGIPMAPGHRAMHDRRAGMRSRLAFEVEQNLIGGCVQGIYVTAHRAGVSAAAAVSRPRKVPVW